MKTAADDDDSLCPPRDCNGPIANQFPINGLTTTGEGKCSPQGTQLMPGSLSGGGCGHGADLRFMAPSDPSESKLVGIRDGEVVCAGVQLRGASFEVRSHNGAVALFTIKDVRPPDGDRAFEAYDIRVGNESACAPTVADSVRQVLGLPEVETIFDAPGYSRGPDDPLVIALPGPLYDETDSTIEEIGDDRFLPDDWFHLACVGDALAKRSLFGLYSPGQDSLNETALKVITARYCGTRAFTLRGVPFSAQPGLRDELEARWSQGRATCLEAPRLLTLRWENGEPVAPDELPDQVQPEGCQGEGNSCDANEWVAKLRAECESLGVSLGPCNERTQPRPEFESRVFVDGVRVVEE